MYSNPAWDRLAADMDGRLARPTDADWDAARQAWNLAVDQRPAAVAIVRSARDVQHVVVTARELGLRVAPQSTGHNAGPLGDLSDTILVKLHEMRGVEIDPAARVARVEGGALWMDVTAAAVKHGLVGLAGSAPDVGVAGYTLGGGIGWYARRLGLQCNTVTAVELVLADGTPVRVTEDCDADLFWALRGGAAPLGVVTALEFGLFPLGTVVAGYLAWDATEVEKVLPGWLAWCDDAPEDATTSFRLVDAPPLPFIPPQLRGRRLVIIDGAFLGNDAAAAAMVAPLRALRPEFDTVTRVPAESLVRLHLEPEGPTPAYASSTLVGRLPDAAIAAVVEAVGPGSETVLAIAELRQLGGALGRPDPDGGALNALDGAFLALSVGFAGDPAMQRIDAARFLTALEPWATGRRYLPMLDDRTDTRKAFPPGVHARLSAVRRSVDPRGLFLDPHAT
jgi:FAD/FMN-containing dehydrogenase